LIDRLIAYSNQANMDLGMATNDSLILTRGFSMMKKQHSRNQLVVLVYVICSPAGWTVFD